MTFLKNLGRYFWVFLPAVTLASMAYAAAFGPPDVAPAWRLGWNPIHWFIITTPWLLPTVIAVPLLHGLGGVLHRRNPPRTARILLILAAPFLFLLILTILWRGSYLSLEAGLPVVAAAALYGSMFRMVPGQGQKPGQAGE